MTFNLMEIEAPSGRIIFASPNISALLEYEQDDLLQMTCLELVHPDDFAHCQKVLMTCIGRLDQKINVSLRWLSKSSKTHTLRITGLVFQEALDKAVYKILSHVRIIPALRFRTTRQKKKHSLSQKRPFIPSEVISTDHESWLRQAQRAGKIGTFDWNIREQLAQVSETYCQIFDLPDDQQWVTTEEWIAKLHPEDRESVLQNFAQMNHECLNYESEYRIILPKRGVRWVSYTGELECDDEGKPQRMLGVIRDITESKHTDEALYKLTEQATQRAREAEERKWILDAMMEQIPIAVVIAQGPEVNILAISPWGRVLFDYPMDQNIHGPIADLPNTWKCMRNEGEAASSLSDLPITRACRFGEVFQGEEWTIVRSDGLKIPVLCSGGPIFDPTGNLWGGVVAFQDCRAQKKAHGAIQTLNTRLKEKVNELKTLLDTLPVGVWMADKGCRKIIGNRSGYEMAGLIPGTNISLTAPADEERVNYNCYYKDQLLPYEQLPMQLVAKTGKPLYNVEFDAVFESGRKVSVYGNVRPILDEQDEVQGVIAAFTDIGERKQMEKALEEQAKALQDADLKKDEFLAMLAHELRNPLAALKSARDLTKKQGLDHNKLNYAYKVFDRQLVQLSRIIDDLLDVSSITHGKIRLRKKLVSLTKILSDVIQSSESMMEVKRHRFRCSIPEQAIWVEVDEVRLEQVLVNILSNACKYTPDGGKVDLTAEQVEQEIVISIQDTGIGLSAELLPKIFDLFIQGDKSLDRSHGGLGIGLTLSKKLIEMHGGSMHAQSEGEGRGSKFMIRLPLAKTTNMPATDKKMTPWSSGKSHSVRILVVDDNPDIATLIGEILEMAGHEVCIAHDGPSCLQKLDVFHPKTVILDIGLPHMNGYEVVKKIKEEGRHQNLCIIALSGYGQPEDIVKSKEIGFHHHLVKPIDEEVLLDIVTRSVS
ncbi:MAG: ATP-binding protein [Oligoflexus sp.]